jgi:hypothetical protein
MPLSMVRCPYCNGYLDLLDDNAELVDGEWWHTDCLDESEDEPYYDDPDDDE